MTQKCAGPAVFECGRGGGLTRLAPDGFGRPADHAANGSLTDARGARERYFLILSRNPPESGAGGLDTYLLRGGALWAPQARPTRKLGAQSARGRPTDAAA